MIPFVTVMTEFEYLRNILDTISDETHYLFALRDFSSAFPKKNYSALKNLVSRSVRKGILERVCKGIYLSPRASFHPGTVLYHIAGRLRASHCNYLSLETVLSDAGIISQVPISWISLMSTGRTYTVDCGKWGTIEFIHTKKRPAALAPQLIYDRSVGLWRASVELALQDMRRIGRPLDLINWDALKEMERIGAEEQEGSGGPI